MEFLANYGLFLLKVATIVIAIIAAVGGVVAVAASSKSAAKPSGKGHIRIKLLHEEFQDTAKHFKANIVREHELKRLEKEEKKKSKSKAKALKKELKTKKSSASDKSSDQSSKKRNFVLNFDGDVNASDVEHLRQEISAILSVANSNDEVVLRLESPGGVVHGYGLAASQLKRISDKDIPLTICVDKVAASGGYMMACIADKILAAPFAIIGSIGVVAQLPNFHKVLKKNDVDFELFTAGDFKRTVTMFGENTEQGKQKFQEELEETHVLFKQFVTENRSVVDIDKVATGEHWFATQAKDLNLVDDIVTSDEYLQTKMSLSDDLDESDELVFEVSFEEKQPLMKRLGVNISDGVYIMLQRILKNDNQPKL